MNTQPTFVAAMIQMRSGLLPEPNFEQGSRLIREAAAQGADFVQTPEVSNIMQADRAALFEHLRAEDEEALANCQNNLAFDLYRLGRYDEALELQEDVVARTPAAHPQAAGRRALLDSIRTATRGS